MGKRQRFHHYASKITSRTLQENSFINLYFWQAVLRKV